MGIFQALINFLFGKGKKRKDIENVTVEVNFLKNWVEKHVNYKFKKVEDEIRGVTNNFEESLDELEEKLEVLENAKLQNDKIPPKAIQIMSGNREAFLRKHRQFIENFNCPSHITYKDVMVFCKEANENLDQLKSTTGKSNYVLMEFYSNEVNAINSVMKNFVNGINQIHDMLDSKADELERIDKSKEKIDSFISKIRLEKQLYSKLSHEKNTFIKTKEERDELQSSIEKFKTLMEYKEVLSLDEERMKAISAIKREEDSIKQKFSPLTRALRKFAHHAIEDNKLIEGYCEEPFKTLMKDNNLKIVNVLEKINQNVTDGKLDVKNDSKIISTISMLNKTTLTQIQTKIEELEEKKHECERKIRLSSAMRDFEEMNYRLKHMDEKLERGDREITEIKRKINKQDLDNEKSNLEDYLSESFNVDLSVVFKDNENK